MKKISRKTVVIASIMALCVLVIAGYVAVRILNHTLYPGCEDIIGDGYAMGTGPAPVVIGNTCDSSE